MNFKRTSIISLIIIFVFSIIVILSLKGINQNYNINQTENIEENIKKSIVQCYALEGSYPPDIKYLADNYGIIIDSDKYIYHYEIFASNIMPIIKVIRK